MFADDLVSCGELEEDLDVMVKRFVDVISRGGLKLNADKRKVMVLGREEGLECEICAELVSLFKYLWLFWVNQVQMEQSVVGR